jgi:demethylmenaquinone methyltransferase/2-methoxy-6-polyprenyl-1,4-benzoquinol methylase
MPSIVLMKAFENAPGRYDRAMELLTLGRLGRVQQEIAGRVAPGARVLDVGCGTARLACALARRGASVLGIDTADAMLTTARHRVAAAALGERVELRRLSALELPVLPAQSFDAVVIALVLSELSAAERACVVADARRLLRPGGRLLVVDEVVPAGRVRRLAMAALRAPLRLVAYLVAQAQALSPRRRALTALYFAIELPLMLLVFFCVPPASRPLADLDELLAAAGFRLLALRRHLGGTLAFVEAGVAA